MHASIHPYTCVGQGACNLHACMRAQASEIRWASRWDTYLMMMDDQIHWFAVINSVMIVLFLSGMVAMIMMRTLRRDISKYNQLESNEDAQEETGWKLVSARVGLWGGGGGRGWRGTGRERTRQAGARLHAPCSAALAQPAQGPELCKRRHRMRTGGTQPPPLHAC